MSTSDSINLILEAIRCVCGKASYTISKFDNSNSSDVGQINSSLEKITKLDKLLNDNLIEAISKTGKVHTIISEENSEPISITNNKEGKYLVGIDPLDGSSNIDIGVSIGTVFGIYKCSNTDSISGNQIVAAGYCLYGAATFYVSVVKGQPIEGWTFDRYNNSEIWQGTWRKTHNNIKMPEISGNYNGLTYSINEGYSDYWGEDIKMFIEGFKKNGMSMRYIGSMVADVHRVLIKGGIFIYPGSKQAPSGKLRYVYEVAPMAFIIEAAGGGSVGILSETVSNIHERYPCIIGSKEIVRDYKK